MSQRVQAMRRVFGAIIGLSSLISLPPLVMALVLGEATVQAFLDTFLIAALVGFALWWPVRHVRYDLRLRDGFLITAGTCWRSW